MPDLRLEISNTHHSLRTQCLRFETFWGTTYFELAVYIYGAYWAKQAHFAVQVAITTNCDNN
jgi:hypothetical protein